MRVSRIASFLSFLMSIDDDVFPSTLFSFFSLSLVDRASAYNVGAGFFFVYLHRIFVLLFEELLYGGRALWGEVYLSALGRFGC